MHPAKQHIYMDHSATTPVDALVAEAMAPYQSDVFGNPSSAHSWGQGAAAALEGARGKVAEVLECRTSEIVFTASGTESDNLAIRGVAWAGDRRHLVTTPIEHPAVTNTIQQLRDLFGFKVTLLPVDRYGRVDPDDVDRAIRPDTALVSVMAASNEVGTTQPIPEISKVCRERDVPLHTDAVQACGRSELAVDRLGVDSLALSAHKFYGPKGVGVLYMRRGLRLVPAVTGGGQELDHRPGTVNVAGAVGLATALDLATGTREAESARLLRLRDRLIEGVLDAVPEAQLTGHPTDRLPHHASFAFRDVEGASVVVALDLEGIAASSGAACAEGVSEPSSVLSAMGHTPDWGIGAVRFTLGRSNTEGHVDLVLKRLPSVITRLRAES